MSSVGFDDPDAFWRHCEDAWMRRLLDDGYAVTRLTDAQGNKVGTAAPMTSFRSLWLRSPDLLATKDGAARYWEVKYRSAPGSNPVTGVAEYWMDYAAFTHYVALDASGTKVDIALYDRSAEGSGHPWFQVPIRALLRLGHRASRAGRDGAEVDAWVWPKEGMQVADEPPVNLADEQTISAVSAKQGDDLLAPVPLEDVTLAAMASRLGIPTTPRYSVLCIAPESQNIDGILDLLHYGIRVFLITANSAEPQRHSAATVAAFRQARLLEWSRVSDLVEEPVWAVDGLLDGVDDDSMNILKAADMAGGFNFEQYKIVHADSSRDLLINAGAGTGKTETMTERLVFLLATSDGSMRLDDAVLVTFTRESAAEMRRRIGLTLITRRRLCERCALPVLEWLLQLANADIDTIHTYSKRLIQRGAASLGLSPGFGVGDQTLEFRRLVRRAASARLSALVASARHVNEVPAEHELVEFVEEIWRTLSGNGLSPLSLAGAERPAADWGPRPAGRDGDLVVLVQEVITMVAGEFASLCLESQKVPVSELVSAAIQVVIANNSVRRLPKVVFIDEYQDTDTEQLELILALRASGARLFVVGDPNQAIYRFRGAQGDAFQSLRALTEDSPFLDFPLTRNFRSGRALLESLHPIFLSMGRAGHLSYDDEAELRHAQEQAEEGSHPVRLVPCSDAAALASMSGEVVSWLEREGETIGILSRLNRHAAQVRDELRRQGVICELLVGGDFFRSPAVREARVLLEAVLAPADDAALLELTATRWFGGLAAAYPPPRLLDADPWGNESLEVMSWAERLAGLSTSHSFNRNDLRALARRVQLMAAGLKVRPMLAWFSEWSTDLRIKSRALHGEDPLELPRYIRCFDHLLTLMDGEFADSPISPQGVLDWLKIQIATNYAEDEPAPSVASGARVTSLTVHRAKGLEFDRVIVPITGELFDATTRRDQRVSVLAGHQPQLVWKWNYRGRNPSALMSRRDAATLWSQDLGERRQEEARLLYVAMTRARQELVVLKSDRQQTVPPVRWSDFL